MSGLGAIQGTGALAGGREGPASAHLRATPACQRLPTDGCTEPHISAGETLGPHAHGCSSSWPCSQCAGGVITRGPLLILCRSPLSCRRPAWDQLPQGRPGRGEGLVPRQVEGPVRYQESGFHGGGDRTTPHGSEGKGRMCTPSQGGSGRGARGPGGPRG